MEKVTLKWRPGKFEDDRERFKLDSLRRDGVRVETLGCDEKVGCERMPRGSAGPRTAAEAMLVVLNTTAMMVFILKLRDNLGALRMFP